MSTPHPASALPPPRHPAPDRAGFTLTELLVALVCTGILGSTIAMLLVAHGRFAALQSAREDAQQNARAVLELIAAELRGVDPHAVTVAEHRTIAFRFPRAWGVVCDHAPERLSVLYPAVAAAALSTGEEFIAVPPLAGAAEWQFLPVRDVASEAAAARLQCEALDPRQPPDAASAPAARMYAPREDPAMPRTLGIAAGESGLLPGTPVYVYDEARYEVGASGAGWWIRRNTGPAMAMHPLAGPVPQGRGLSFVYRDGSGGVLAAPSSQRERNRIRSVEVAVVTQSRTRFNGVPLRDSLATRVALRNPR